MAAVAIVRRRICLLIVMVFAVPSCTGSNDFQRTEGGEDSPSDEVTSASDPGREHLVRTVETHVLVVGVRIPREERAAMARTLDLSQLESITVHAASDSLGRELIGDEEDMIGAIVLVTSSGGEAGVEPNRQRTVVSRPDLRNETVFEVRQITDRLRDAPWVSGGEDPEGDGQRSGFQDGRALSYWLDVERDTLWVRLRVYGEIDPELPAVSLSFDLDDDQETGIPWYGSNTTFHFEKMVSVGPVTRGNDRFVGYNGITDADGVRRRDWINERQGNIAFLLDPAGRSYIVGVALTDLGPRSSRLRFIGSVGHRATWNDDLIDQGYATVRVPQPSK